MNSTKEWLTVVEAAERASVSPDTIYEACLRRQLKHTKATGRRIIRLRVQWIDEWLERHVRDVQPPDTKASIAKLILGLTEEKAGR